MPFAVHTGFQRISEHKLLLMAWFGVLFLGIISTFTKLEIARPRTQAPVVVPKPTSVPFYTLKAEPTPPQVTAQSVWIYDRKNDSLLYQENAQQATAVASLAKLMTALVSYEEFRLDDSVQIGSASAAVGNRAKFLARDKFSVSSLLHALLIFSANDAAEALSWHAPTGMSGFVEKMNAKAQKLRLRNTHFANPSGLDNPKQYSSAEDVGKIADAVLEVPTLSEIVRLPTANIRELQTGRIDTVYTTNSLLHKDPRYQGMKTGTTEMAGESLVVRFVDDAYQPQGLDIILVILGSQKRFQEAEKLSAWLEEALVPISSVSAQRVTP